MTRKMICFRTDDTTRREFYSKLALEGGTAQNYLEQTIKNYIEEEKTMKKISVTEDGVWAGTGTFNNGSIENCAAVLGDDRDMSERAYDAIEEAIADGETSVAIGDYIWEWEIIAAGELL